MSTYDQWLERGPVDALTKAEAEDSFFEMAYAEGECPRCGAVRPDDDCERGRCDDPRVP